MENLSFKNEYFISLTKIALVVIAIIFILLPLTSCGQTIKDKTEPPKAINGVLDLTEWNFTEAGTVALNGQWELYWHALLSPEDFHKSMKPQKNGFMEIPRTWNGYNLNGISLPRDGFATYRLVIKTNTENDIYTLKTKYMFSAYKLWVNNKLLCERGVIGKTRAESIPRWAPDIVSFTSDNNICEVVIQISSFGFDRSGFVRDILVGTEKQINALSSRQKDIEMFLVGSLTIMGVYLLSVFLLRRKDRASFYFGLLCLLVALRTMVMGEMILYSLLPNLSIEIFLKISFLTMTLGLTIFIMSLEALYPLETPKWFVILSVTIGFLFSAISLFTSDSISNKFLLPFEIFAIAVGIGISYIIAAALIRKRAGVNFMAVFIVIFIVAAVNDVLSHMRIILTPLILPFGTFAFPLAHSLMLSWRYSKSFSTIENLSERLLSLDKLKDEFLANTSHELRTPLSGIVGIAESMLEGAAGQVDEQVSYNLSMIALSGRRLTHLVNDILDLSKLKNNEILLQKKSVDLKAVVEIVLAVLTPLAQVKSLELINSISSKAPLVDADENRVQQILHNLVGNAIKFTEKGYVEVSSVIKNGFVEVVVADTGIGIPKDKFEDIFKSFEQLDGSISRQHNGVGLGLNITKQLVELHGGIISVESVLGKGSRFTFSLSISAHDIESRKGFVLDTGKELEHIVLPNRIENKLASNSMAKILVVDDELVNLQVISNYLSLQNYSIYTAYNGEEALRLIEESGDRGFDLIMLDIMMPRISGYQLCRLLREKYSLIEMPVLMLTAKNQTDDSIAGFESGANDYLSKPFDKSELLARVNMLLNLRKSGEQEKMLRKAELKALQAQIKPHFLLNTLNTVMYLCRINPIKAEELLLELGNFLRSGFNFKNTDEFIPFEDELRNIRSYLSIEQARFGDLLKVIYDIEDNLNCKLPSFILQPLVENAVKHGLFPKKEGGTVKISAIRDNGVLIINIEDDGIGMPEYKVKDLLKDKEHEGVGVANVNKRLKSIYGQGLDIRSDNGKGTVITLRIPLAGGKHHDKRNLG